MGRNDESRPSITPSNEPSRQHMPHPLTIPFSLWRRIDMAAAAAFGFHPHSHSNFLPNGHSLTPFQFESKWIDPNRPENDIKTIKPLAELLGFAFDWSGSSWRMNPIISIFFHFFHLFHLFHLVGVNCARAGTSSSADRFSSMDPCTYQEPGNDWIIGFVH